MSVQLLDKPKNDAHEVHEEPALKFDKTINLPLVITVVTLMFTAVWWTSHQSSRLDRMELTQTASRSELSERILETRTASVSRLAEISTRLENVATQTADQWRALDRITERLTASDRERLIADQRLEQQIDRLVVTLSSLREQLLNLGRQPASRPHQQGDFNLIQPWDESPSLAIYYPEEPPTCKRH